MSVNQPVNLDRHLVGQYQFSETEDRTLVDNAIVTGTANAAEYTVLEYSLCLDPRSTAESLLREKCPALMVEEPRASSSSATEVLAIEYPLQESQSEDP